MKLLPSGVKEYDEMRSIVWDDDMVAIDKYVRKLEAVVEAAGKLLKAEHCGLVAYRYVNSLEDALADLE